MEDSIGVSDQSRKLTSGSQHVIRAVRKIRGGFGEDLGPEQKVENIAWFLYAHGKLSIMGKAESSHKKDENYHLIDPMSILPCCSVSDSY